MSTRNQLQGFWPHTYENRGGQDDNDNSASPAAF